MEMKTLYIIKACLYGQYNKTEAQKISLRACKNHATRYYGTECEIRIEDMEGITQAFSAHKVRRDRTHRRWQSPQAEIQAEGQLSLNLN